MRRIPSISTRTCCCVRTPLRCRRAPCSPRSRPSALSAPAECTAQMKWMPPTARFSPVRRPELVIDKGITMANLKGHAGCFLRTRCTARASARASARRSSVHGAVRRGRCDLRRLQGRRLPSAKAPAGSRFWARVWSIPMCWRCAASIRTSTPTLPSASASSASPTSSTTCPICVCCLKMTCVSWRSSEKRRV